jgi:lipoprotein-anchoring transpeptidase ErfK/SrfK
MTKHLGLALGLLSLLATGVDGGTKKAVSKAVRLPKVSKKTAKARKPEAKKQADRASRTPLTTPEIRDLELRLRELGYWAGKADGKWDEASRHALIAFQKVTGRPRNGQPTRSERAAVSRAHRPVPRQAGPAHVEIDLDRQVLYLVDETGVITRVLPVSTGNGKEFKAEGWIREAITPIGRFNIRGKVQGWRKSALGRLYYPNYIIGGIAIHGYQSVPTKPASHGCIRIPMYAAVEFSKLTPNGMEVLIYEGLMPAPPMPTSIDAFKPIK